MSDSNTWRHKGERTELVERLIASERRCRLLERTLTEYAEAKDEDGTVGSYVTALQARIAQLEENVERLIHRRKAS